MNNPGSIFPNLDQVLKALHFIEANLYHEITIADVAAASCWSLFHFCRCFNSLVHITPYDYLIKRRLSEGASQLTGTDKKIIEIAFDLQFNNHETFSRAFKRMFGLQPNQYRKTGTVDRRLLMPPLGREHIIHFNGGCTAVPGGPGPGKLELTGFTAPDFLPGIEEITRLKQELPGQPAQNGALYYRAAFYPETSGRVLYLTGAPLAPDCLPGINPFIFKIIPELPYACFLHQGPETTISLSLDYIYQVWFPRSGQQQLFPFELFRYTFPDPLSPPEITIFLPIIMGPSLTI